MSASTTASASAMSLRDDLSLVLRSARVRVATTTLTLFAAASATVDADAARWMGIRGPECLVGLHFGAHVCPACGLVRSVASTVQGNFQAAFSFHPSGPILVLLGLIILAVDLIVLHRSEERRSLRSWRGALKVASVTALLLGWMTRWALPSSAISSIIAQS